MMLACTATASVSSLRCSLKSRIGILTVLLLLRPMMSSARGGPDGGSSRSGDTDGDGPTPTATGPFPKGSMTASATTSTTSSSGVSSGSQSLAGGSGPKLSTGAIVGIALGSALVLLILAVVVFYLWGRYRHRQALRRREKNKIDLLSSGTDPSILSDRESHSHTIGHPEMRMADDHPTSLLSSVFTGVVGRSPPFLFRRGSNASGSAMTRSGSQRSHASRVPRPLVIPTPGSRQFPDGVDVERAVGGTANGNLRKEEEAGVTSQTAGEGISYPTMSVQNQSPAYPRNRDSALYEVDEVPRSPTDSNDQSDVGPPSPAVSVRPGTRNTRRVRRRTRDEEAPPPSYEATLSQDMKSNGHGEV